MTVQVMVAESHADIAACMELRRTVFVNEQGVSEADERDGNDSAVVHFLARLNGQPTGTLRVRVLDRTGKIERVCVLKHHRGEGLGAALTRRALEYLAGLPDVAEVGPAAQVQVVGFYEGLGFRTTGNEYLDAGIAHRDMARAL